MRGALFITASLLQRKTADGGGLIGLYMFYVIISLVIFSIILVCMEYQNRYCWLFIIMVAGMELAFFSMSLQLAKFGNYYYSFLSLFSLDYTIFSYASNTFKLPISTLARIMNTGIALYLLAAPLFIYDFIKIKDHRSIPAWIFLVLVVYNLLFYDPGNAYRIYISYNRGGSSVFYANCIYVLHQVNRIWIFFYLFYPVFILCRFMVKNTFAFIRRQIFLLALCLAVMNILFYSVFFMGPFMMSPVKAFTSGFWIFENIQVLNKTYYLIIPVTLTLVLLFTLLLLPNYRMGSLVHIFVDRKIQRNISRMNELLSDTLHTQKNLLFSINILAGEAMKAGEDRDRLRELVLKIHDLSDSSLKRTSEMLESLRAIRYKFKNNDLVGAIDEALEKINFPPGIRIIWDKNNYDREQMFFHFDYYHMNRVFINVLTNAIEAVTLAQRSDGFIKIDITIQFHWIFIIIQDNGTGIKKLAIRKMFEPYYSDKTGFLNWGLGMSYAYKVVKSHWGNLRVESSYGEGTTVQIMVPRLINKEIFHGKNTGINC